jgi:HSP20 family protein
MSIIKYNPFNEMDNLWEDFFNEGKFIPVVPKTSMMMPPVDVYDDKDNVYVDVALSGIDPKDVNIEIENGTLTIKGNLEKKTEIDEINYYKKEIRKSSFARQIALPADVYSEKADAVYENGVLKISIPKKEEIKPKRIEVKIKK